MTKHFGRFCNRLRRAGDGAVMIEFSIIAVFLMFLTCGMVDFTLAFQQWNNAAKASELGARLAATSNHRCHTVLCRPTAPECTK